MAGNDIISLIAVLKAKPGKTNDIKQALAHFQVFVARMDELLAKPLRLNCLLPVEE